MLLSSLFLSGFLGFGDGVSATIMFSESSSGRVSLGLLISTGAGLKMTTQKHSNVSKNRFSWREE